VIHRRHFLGVGLGAAWGATGCQPAVQSNDHITGGFTGVHDGRGHWLRDAQQADKGWPAPAKTFHTRILIAGRRRGRTGCRACPAPAKALNDFALLELEDTEAGGNSRGGESSRTAPARWVRTTFPCPATTPPRCRTCWKSWACARAWLADGNTDERHLCHSPQERLFFNGEWQDGLLPLQGVGADTLDTV
jgi:hypothetical protein